MQGCGCAGLSARARGGPHPCHASVGRRDPETEPRHFLCTQRRAQATRLGPGAPRPAAGGSWGPGFRFLLPFLFLCSTGRVYIHTYIHTHMHTRRVCPCVRVCPTPAAMFNSRLGSAPRPVPGARADWSPRVAHRASRGRCLAKTNREPYLCVWDTCDTPRERARTDGHAHAGADSVD